MDNHRVIGIFDSGVGGLSTWRELVHQLPNVTTLYLADQAHVPYGSRPPDELGKFAVGITRFLLGHGAQIIVIASNTTSAASLYYLRDHFPDVPFIGTEPALKPAIEQTQSGVVGVMATPTTFHGRPFTYLVERYASNVRVLTQVCPGLVEAVETDASDSSEVEALLRKYLTPLIEAGVDQLVLGCTHYSFLRSTIEQLVGVRVAVIDPAPAVARQAVRVLTEQKLDATSIADPKSYRRHIFYTTGDVAKFTNSIERLLPSAAEESLDVRSIRWKESCLEG
jgi:glutamate racemase